MLAPRRILLYKAKHPLANYESFRNLSKRVVVTGLGIVSSVGCNMVDAWKNIRECRSGIKHLGDKFLHLPCQIGGIVDESALPYLEETISTDIVTRAGRYAIIAAAEAITDAGLDFETLELDHIGVCIGSAHPDIHTLNKSYKTFLNEGYSALIPGDISRVQLHIPAAIIGFKYNLQGPVVSFTAGSATGVMVIGEAFKFVKYLPSVRMMICGATEACIAPFVLAGYCNMNRLVTTSNHAPEEACRPYDIKRAGMALGEGAGILVIEDLEHAIQRKARIYCEIKGYNTRRTNIASANMSLGIQSAFERCLENSKLKRDSISYVNTNGSGCPVADYAEAIAIQNFFGDRSWELFVSSTQGAHGNLLGASGAVELLFCCMACYDGILPPTVNVDMSNNEFVLNFIPEPNTEYYSLRRNLLKISTSFAGICSCICMCPVRI